MPHITVEMLPGRSEETKKKITAELSRTLAEFAAVSEDAISVTIKDVTKEEWKQMVYNRFMSDESTLYQKPGYTM